MLRNQQPANGYNHPRYNVTKSIVNSINGSSVMSCNVPDDLNDAIHFVDGAAGGYAQPSNMLKVNTHHLRNPEEP